MDLNDLEPYRKAFETTTEMYLGMKAGAHRFYMRSFFLISFVGHNILSGIFIDCPEYSLKRKFANNRC